MSNLVIWGNGSDDLIRTWDTKKENLNALKIKGLRLSSIVSVKLIDFYALGKQSSKKPQILKKKKKTFVIILRVFLKKRNDLCRSKSARKKWKRRASYRNSLGVKIRQIWAHQLIIISRLVEPQWIQINFEGAFSSFMAEFNFSWNINSTK